MDCNNPEWIKSRKAEWKEVKNVLGKRVPDIRSSEYRGLRDYFMTGVENDVFEEIGEDVLLNLWLHPDISTERWAGYWHELTQREFKGNRYSRDYEQMQYEFFKLSTESRSEHAPYTDYGFCGGLEERIVKFLVPGQIYSDETSLILNYPCRQVPWKNKRSLHIDFIGECKKFLQYPGSNPYSPMQYLAELWLSVTDSLEDLSYAQEMFRRAAWYNALSENELDGSLRDKNRWLFSRRFFDLLASETLPAQLDTYFRQAKDNPIARGESA